MLYDHTKYIGPLKKCLYLFPRLLVVYMKLYLVFYTFRFTTLNLSIISNYHISLTISDMNKVRYAYICYFQHASFELIK